MSKESAIRRVEVGASRPYQVRIGPGLLMDAGEHLRDIAGPCKAMVVSDDRVFDLYGQAVTDSLNAAGYQSAAHVFPQGEASKNLEVLGGILEAMAGERLTKSDIVLALGGGVVGDIAGLAAAVYGRGMPFAQLPTTLLAAVDSSVGGKTAVNLRAGKNLAGAFWQPSLVLADTEVLEGLPEELRAEGIAEIVKYGVLADPELFSMAQAGELFRDIGAVVARCVAIKRDYVLGDERDEGKRQALNLGHTLGHAAEKLSGYTLSHGKGVAIGLALMARAAENMGQAQAGLAGQVRQALRVSGLPVDCPYGAQEMLEAALSDKKRRGESITLVVPQEIGRCGLRRIPIEELRAWIDAGLGG